MAGKIYGVGAGPGDPELITLKAKRILETVSVIAVPKASYHKKSLALSIIKPLLSAEKEILELVFPMTHEQEDLKESWKNAVVRIQELLEQNRDVAFVTLGDPTLYSTYMYIHRELRQEGYVTEIIPGVTSFSASAARISTSLAENRETLAVIPSAYECESIDQVLHDFDNLVFMKVSGNFAWLRDKLREKGWIEKAVLVSRCGLEDESISFDINQVEENQLSYFSTMILKKNGVF